MKTATTEETKPTKASVGMPTMKEALAAGKDLGLIAAGLIAAHGVVTVTKKDTALVNGGLLVAGFAAAVAIKNPYVKMLGLGMATYGGVKLIGHVAKEVTSPGTTEGLNGILPEKVKAMVRKFIPTLSGMDEYAGVGNAGDDELNSLSLDDFGTRESSTYSQVSGMEEYAGIGSAENIAA